MELNSEYKQGSIELLQMVCRAPLSLTEQLEATRQDLHDANGRNTDLNHEIERLKAELPAHIEPAYDMMRIVP